MKLHAAPRVSMKLVTRHHTCTHKPRPHTCQNQEITLHGLHQGWARLRSVFIRLFKHPALRGGEPRRGLRTPRSQTPWAGKKSPARLGSALLCWHECRYLRAVCHVETPPSLEANACVRVTEPNRHRLNNTDGWFAVCRRTWNRFRPQRPPWTHARGLRYENTARARAGKAQTISWVYKNSGDSVLVVQQWTFGTFLWPDPMLHVSGTN